LPSRTISQEPITMPKPHAFRPDALDHALENRQVLSHISLTAAAQHNRLNLGQQQVGKNLINTGKVSGLPGSGTNHQTVSKTSSARVSLGTTAGRTLSPVQFANGLVTLNNGFTVNTGISNGLAFNNGLGTPGTLGQLTNLGAQTGLAFQNGLGLPGFNGNNAGLGLQTGLANNNGLGLPGLTGTTQAIGQQTGLQFQNGLGLPGFNGNNPGLGLQTGLANNNGLGVPGFSNTLTSNFGFGTTFNAGTALGGTGISTTTGGVNPFVTT
jgi:hypothetical protein